MLKETSIDTRDNRGMSLLHWTVACKQKEVFDFLVEKDIDINAENNLKQTPMHTAIRFSNEDYFDLLEEAQPNSKWKTKYGASLLEKAVLTKNKAFINKLIESDIDINSTNTKGSTALEIALRSEANDLVELLLSLGADRNKVRITTVEGPYMGQREPGTTPQVFAPNFISTEEYEFGSVFNEAGEEFYFGVDVNGKSEIRLSKRLGTSWSKTKTILSHERYGYNDPFLSPDEQRLYFISRRALDGVSEPKEDHDIWYVERTAEGWSDPINAGPNINTSGNEYYSSFTRNGTMYFSSNKNAPAERKQSDFDIYYSKFLNGKFGEAMRLGNFINTEAYEADVFIDPDENYLIFCSIREEGFGRGDLYISFKNSDGSWTKAVNMGDKINTVGHELCPFVTRDGNYLFYTSKEDIYWVSTELFDEIKEKK